MAPQDDAALEAQEQVLAGRLDRLETPPVEPRRKLLDRCARMRSLDLDPFADEHLQPPGRAGECVSLGHGRKRTAREVTTATSFGQTSVTSDARTCDVIERRRATER